MLFVKNSLLMLLMLKIKFNLIELSFASKYLFPDLIERNFDFNTNH